MAGQPNDKEPRVEEEVASTSDDSSTDYDYESEELTPRRRVNKKPRTEEDDDPNWKPDKSRAETHSSRTRTQKREVSMQLTQRIVS
jgi:hypothetical protein